MGVTSGPTTILNTPRVLEARNLYTEQSDTLDQGEDIARSTQIQDEDYYDINDFRNPPPPPSPFGRNGDKRGFATRHVESSPLRNIAPVSIAMQTPPPPSSSNGQRAKNGNTIF